MGAAFGLPECTCSPAFGRSPYELSQPSTRLAQTSDSILSLVLFQNAQLMASLNVFMGTNDSHGLDVAVKTAWPLGEWIAALNKLAATR